jgi:hypothetical protein
LYVTHDGESASTEEVKLLKMPPSVYSVDVLKAGTIFTATPHGEMRLLDYFKKVENSIKKEKSERIQDVTKINAMMAKNAEINRRARATMKRQLLHKINVNAKRAAKALHNEMVRTQRRFAAAAKLANARQRALSHRMAAMRRTVLANKREAKRQLQAAVLAQQRALAAQASTLNSKIRQTNKRVTANANQIKANAKHAAKMLQRTVRHFNHKLNNFRAEARKGRSRLAQQMAAQDKKTRAWANNKLAAAVANTAAQFQAVRKRMAADRKRASRMVRSASGKMTAALSAQAALENRRFTASMKNIAAAQSESNRKLHAAKTQMKMSMLQLNNVVKQQEHKLRNRINQVAGKVESNRKAQMQVNRRLNAEMKRIVKVGDKREQARLKANARLRGIMRKNASRTSSYLARMRNTFNARLSKLQRYARQSRRLASHQLKAATSGLVSTIARNQAAQNAKNRAMAAATARARLDAMDAMRRAKDEFRRRMQGMSNRMSAINRKQSKAYRRLTGVVARNAVKSAQGRNLLRMRQKAQGAAMKNAINAAVHAGERRSARLAAKMKGMNKATRAVLMMKISSQVAKLKRWTNKSLVAARMESKRERAALKREMTFAISAAKNEAKSNLKRAMGKVNGQLARAAKLAARRARASARARAALSRRINANRRAAARRLTAAVAGLNRARLAFADQTNKRIAKTNAKVSASAKQLQNDIKKTNAKMAATYRSMNAKMAANAQALKSGLANANRASRARQMQLMRWQRRAMAKAQRRVNRQFNKAYSALAATRKRADRRLASSVSAMNAALAKQSALNDRRFRHTVKSIAAAKRQASAQVARMSRSFRTSIVSVTATVKNVAARLQGEIGVVSGEVRNNARRQALLNRKVSKEMGRIVSLSNQRWSAAKRARGQLRKVMAANKLRAARMVNALAAKTAWRLAKVRRQAAHFRRSAAKALSRTTKRLYVAMTKNRLAQKRANKALKGQLKVQHLQAMAAIRAQRKDFRSKLSNLANTVAANGRKQSRGLARLSGIVKRNAAKSKADRAAIKNQQSAMQLDLNKSIRMAIQRGEARARAVASRAAKNLKRATMTLKNEMSTSIERAADKVFATVNGGRQKIADNYLSLKAYCVSAKFKWQAYRKKAKQPLVSIGDLCATLGGMANLVPRASPGIGMGRKNIKPLFGGKIIKGKGAVKRINGLVDEYMKTVVTVRNRWPFGIGKYLLARLEASMQGRGCLEVSKIGAGQAVFVNARAVGLTNRLNDFRSLAVGMKVYESTLSRLTQRLAKRKKPSKKRRALAVSPPEWDGK